MWHVVPEHGGMTIPWTASLAAKVLAAAPDERVRTMTYHAFQIWPAVKPLPADVGQSLLDAERAVRRMGRAA